MIDADFRAAVLAVLVFGSCGGDQLQDDPRGEVAEGDMWMTFKGFRKDAPLMVEAVEPASVDGANAPRTSIGIATKAGAA